MVISPSVRNQDKTETSFEVDTVQGNVQASGLVHSDRRLVCIRWREKAQVVEKQGFHRPIDSWPFQSVRPGCATKTRLRPVPMMVPSKAMYEFHVLCTLIGGLRAYGGVGTLKSLKKGFHGPIDSRPYLAVPSRCATKSRLRPVPKLIQSKAMYNVRVSLTLIGCFRAYGGVGRLKSLKRRAFTDPSIIGHFGHFALGAQPRHDLDLFRS